MDVPRKLTTARGLAVEYAERGQGRPVLLLHGNSATWRWWREVLEAGVAGVRLVAPTMRGCLGTRGGSDPSAYVVPALASDVMAFADALGLEQFDLVGHSLGGAVALACALDFPHRVKGLHLVAAASGDGMESMRERKTGGSSLRRFLDPSRALGRAALFTAVWVGRDFGMNRRWLRKVLPRMMPRAQLAAERFNELIADAAAVEPLAVVSFYRSLSKWDVRARHATLTVPTRVLAGREDALVRLEALEALTRAIPKAQLEVLDCGHSPMLELPEAFMAWLRTGLTPAA